MLSYFFIILLLIFFILFYYFYNLYEKFIVCENKPTGPYPSYCSLIKFNDNILSAYCKNITGSNKNNSVYSTLDMNNCSNQDDCYSVNVNSNGELTC